MKWDNEAKLNFLVTPTTHANRTISTISNNSDKNDAVDFPLIARSQQLNSRSAERRMRSRAGKVGGGASTCVFVNAQPEIALT
jgi:hypothetical protein